MSNQRECLLPKAGKAWVFSWHTTHLAAPSALVQSAKLSRDESVAGLFTLFHASTAVELSAIVQYHQKFDWLVSLGLADRLSR
jgi:hypothetical protein